MARARPQPITLEPHHRPGFAQFRIKQIGRCEKIVGERIEGRNRKDGHRKSSMMDAAPGNNEQSYDVRLEAETTTLEHFSWPGNCSAISTSSPVQVVNLTLLLALLGH